MTSLRSGTGSQLVARSRSKQNVGARVPVIEEQIKRAHSGFKTLVRLCVLGMHEVVIGDADSGVRKDRFAKVVPAEWAGEIFGGADSATKRKHQFVLSARHFQR